MYHHPRAARGVALSCLLPCVLSCACSSMPELPPSAHVTEQKTATGPPAPYIYSLPSAQPPAPPLPKKAETYSVAVHNVKAQDLLFALARDAKLNIDVHAGINGQVTLNALNQTLPQLLERIARQVDMRWELHGGNLSVMPDTPYTRTYKVDYVNLSREASGTISASSQISTSNSGGGDAGAGASGGSGSNISTAKVENKNSNRFWASLETNIRDLLRDTTQQHQSDAGKEAKRASNDAGYVIVNAESGIVNIRATSRQHQKVAEFIDKVVASARRQVMIEATIVEVTLNDTYKQGIEWSRFRPDGSGFSIKTPGMPSNTFTLENLTKGALDLTLTLNLLDQFGEVKVLSSPRLSVLNNQSALLKVVENYVYFSVKSDIAVSNTVGANPIKAFTTTPQSVSVGLVMVVTPQISENNSITLNVRPSITSISDFAQDPNPDLTIENKVPMIRTREIESIMRVENGEIAVLGGLMQEKADYLTARIPLIGAIPMLGEAFTRRENLVSKSELVIFLRPVVVNNPGMNGDYKNLRPYLPANDFLNQPDHAQPFGTSGRQGMQTATSEAP